MSVNTQNTVTIQDIFNTAKMSVLNCTSDLIYLKPNDITMESSFRDFDLEPSDKLYILGDLEYKYDVNIDLFTNEEIDNFRRKISICSSLKKFSELFYAHLMLFYQRQQNNLLKKQVMEKQSKAK